MSRAGHLAAADLAVVIERILAPLGRRLDRTTPIVDARLPDGSRVCAVIPPVSPDGACLSVRRFRDRSLAARRVRRRRRRRRARAAASPGAATSSSAASTSSGKTSLLNATLGCCPPGERIVTIEDTVELLPAADHLVRLEARPPTPDGPSPITLEQLVRTALRLRPDRLVVGEVRGPEVLALVQALNTGHDGSWSTCHANSAVDALHRLETLVIQAAPTWPLVAVRQHLTRSIDVVVHVARGARRRPPGGRGRRGRRRPRPLGAAPDRRRRRASSASSRGCGREHRRAAGAPSPSPSCRHPVGARPRASRRLRRRRRSPWRRRSPAGDVVAGRPPTPSARRGRRGGVVRAGGRRRARRQLADPAVADADAATATAQRRSRDVAHAVRRGHAPRRRARAPIDGDPSTPGRPAGTGAGDVRRARRAGGRSRSSASPTRCSPGPPSASERRASQRPGPAVGPRPHASCRSASLVLLAVTEPSIRARPRHTGRARLPRRSGSPSNAARVVVDAHR